MILLRAHRAVQAKSCGTVGGVKRKVGKPVALTRVQRGVALQDGSQRANSDQKDSWSRVARVSAWCKVKCVVAEKLSTGCMKFFVILRLYFGCHYHHQLSAVSFIADKKKLYRSTVCLSRVGNRFGVGGPVDNHRFDLLTRNVVVNVYDRFFRNHVNSCHDRGCQLRPAREAGNASRTDVLLRRLDPNFRVGLYPLD